MKSVYIFLAVTALVGLQGCSTAKLSETGGKIEIVNQLVRKDCKNLGPVYGKGGGSFGGVLISDEKLMEYASNDLRNNAASKGATHVVTQTHQMDNTIVSTSTATQSGVAYKCP